MMKHKYTVSWDASAQDRLAELWLGNPAIRREISSASDEIESALAVNPTSIGETSGISRYVVKPPVAIFFRVAEDDRQVRILHVKHWLD